MKSEENNTKSALIEAFDKSETKAISDLCRIAGVSRFTFYYHFNKDANFKKQLKEKQRQQLASEIAAV